MNTSEVSAQARRIPDYDKSKYETYGGVDVAEIEVDTELGLIRVKRFLAVHDCGRPDESLAGHQPDQRRFDSGDVVTRCMRIVCLIQTTA